MFIDSHCHLQLFQKNESIDQIVQEAIAVGVNKMLCVATNVDQYQILKAIRKQHSIIDISLGVHPHETFAPDYSDKLQIALKASDIVAIGETGLDYHYQDVAKIVQQERFDRQLHLASIWQKPIILHTRLATIDTLSFLQKYSGVLGVAHCFTESLDFAKQVLDLGWYISFSGIITFKKAADLVKIVKFVPLERILVETDSPYLAPVPFRGKTNYPKYVIQISKFLAELKGIALDEALQQMRINYDTLFGS